MTFTFHPSVPRGIVTGITILTVVSLLIYLIQQYKPLKPIATWHFGGEDVFQPLSYIPPTGLGTWQIPKSKVRINMSSDYNVFVQTFCIGFHV